MQRPEVRIIANQEETKNVEVNVSSSEAYALMAKYGFKPTDIVAPPPPQIINDPNRNLTFEEMMAIEDNKIRAERQRAEMHRQEEMNRPQPYSFDRRNINYHNTKFETLDDQFGIQIQVVSDMPINKGYGY